MRSRRTLFALLGVLPTTLLLSSPAVAIGPPTIATGSVTVVNFAFSSEQIVGAVFMFDFTETDAYTGDLTGTSVLEGSCVAHPPGIVTCQALETFTGTVDGLLGTAEFWNVLTVDLATDSFSGRFTALGGTGDLANLQAQGTFEGAGPAGTYTLRITFAP